jgi:hypothetical protein
MNARLTAHAATKKPAALHSVPDQDDDKHQATKPAATANFATPSDLVSELRASLMAVRLAAGMSPLTTLGAVVRGDLEAIAVVPVRGLCAIRKDAIRLRDRFGAAILAETVRIMVWRIPARG